MVLRLATRYLSAPKREDVILTAFTARLYAIVLADGASSYRRGGTETSGGGRRAAEIAAHTAISSLIDPSLASMGIEGMIASLRGCFFEAQIALETHNAVSATPGGTTLLIALLWQGERGQWYWLYGHLGNGVLALLHAQRLLAGWPIHTPLLSKHASGVMTVTLPGYAPGGSLPSLGVRPHNQGDLLVIGSDGLIHLDTVTMKCDRLSFHNYLWTKLQDGQSSLEHSLQRLQNGRADTPWRNALALDDTTIGILWT